METKKFTINGVVLGFGMVIDTNNVYRADKQDKWMVEVLILPESLNAAREAGVTLSDFWEGRAKVTIEMESKDEEAAAKD